ncbi:MAG: AIR synthase related protein [Kiritimatiellae bacterium]|nr:AIR synthase related protein [Kiritimatiellia bacterium]
MNEESFIRSLQRIHGMRPYESDADCVPSGEGELLVSSDSFSLQEDFLAGLALRDMGRLMAYGACTDLLACGASPKAMTQVWTCSATEPMSFYEQVATGIQDVLVHYDMRLLGGDVAMAAEWSWSATVMGRVCRPVRRVASARVDFDLYVSDPLGAANAAVALARPLPMPVWCDPVPAEALFATDTSGGFLDAMENFRRVNPGLWMEVDCDRAIAREVVDALPSGVEPGWTLVGGVGEYALVFAVPAGTPVPNGIWVGHGGFRAETVDTEIRLNAHGCTGRIKASPPDWRSVAPKDRLGVVAKYWQGLFEG